MVFCPVKRCLATAWILLGTLIVAALAGSAAAAQSVLLDGTSPARLIGKYVYSIPDPQEELDIDTVRTLFVEGSLQKRQQDRIDFGYSRTAQWIVIPLQNISHINASYLLSTNWPFINQLDAYLIVPGRDQEQIISKQPHDPYGANEYSGIALVSSQFILPPRSEALMIARFKPFAFGILPLSFETPLTAYERSVLDNIGLTAFYSAVLAAAFIFMLFVIAIRHAGGLYFLGIIVSGLLIITQLDGLFFAYVWPQFPLWDRVAPFCMLCFVNFTSFALAAYMFRSAKMSRLSRHSRQLSYISLLPLFCLLFIDPFWLIIVAYVFLIAAMAALLFAIVVWTKLLPRKRQIAFALGTAMLVIVATIVFLVIAGFDGVNIASHNLIKLLYVVMILASMIAYATHISALNRNYANSLKRELQLARNEAKMNADLLASERKFAEAQELVARHKHRLATTSHDLKQPIASLRLTLDAMAKSGGKKVEENVARAFDYLEDLVNENLHGETDSEASADPADTEKVSLDLLFETIVQMFKEEAVSKGITLEKQPGQFEIETEIIPFMRILNNLVSNSVKHTEKGGVKISSGSKNDAIVVEISDTGPGMSDAEIARYATLYEKGEQSDGTGLGLPICFELANRLGMELTIQSQTGKGSTFRLRVNQSAGNGTTSQIS